MTNDFLTQSTTEAETYKPKIVFKKRKNNMKIREKTDNTQDCIEQSVWRKSGC